MVHYKKGNLLEATQDIIAHGCNCSGGFGRGVAGQIAKKWPAVKAAYFRQYNAFGWKLGFTQYVDVGDKIIVNCGTQEKYFPLGVCHANYAAIHAAMNEVRDYAKQKGLSIAIPKIGAGLAGGDWNDIRNILEEVFFEYNVTVYEF